MNGVNDRRNPYITGRPIRKSELLFGRESLFRFIQDSLNQDVKVILLHGQRRIGKSSVLQQISNFIQSNEFIFVQFDLQDKSQSNLSNIIHNLAIAIKDELTELEVNVNNLQIPTKTELEQEISLFSQSFLLRVYERINLKKYTKIVLLLDEFDVANNEINDINILEQENFFPYLKELLNEQDKLFIIPVVGRYINDLPNLLSLFEDAHYEEIGLIDNISTRRMIANPAKGILTYEPEAIEKILQLSAGHPCFTQVICSTLFEQARSYGKWDIESADVERIVNQAIEKADSFCQGFWDILTIPEKIIISTVAEAQKIATEQRIRVPEEPLNLLKKNGINKTEQLSQAWERLIKNRHLSDDGHKIRVELIRHWLLKEHPVQREIQSLNIVQHVNNSNINRVGRRNPYIIGRPIYERSKFFGRESLFHFIEDNLNQNVKVILLHGQRGIGKSSVLQNIPNFIQLNEFIFIQFDLYDKGNLSLSNILYNLALTITETLNIDVDDLRLPTRIELEQELTSFSDKFLPQIYQKIGNTNLVLLLDEFEVGNNDIHDRNIVEQGSFFPYLAKLINKQDNLFVISVNGRKLHDLPKLLSLFKGAPYAEIGLLDDISAKRMITNPVEGILIYEPEAIQKILQLSAGHPYFTKVICFTVFEQARNEDKWSIERADVEQIVNQAIKNVDSLLQSFWDLLTIPERIIISTVAEAQKIAIEQGRKVPEEPLYLLKRNGINQKQQLSQAWETLIENRYLYDDGRKVTVELIRRWLLQYHSIENEIQGLKTQELQTEENQNVEHLVKNLIGVANFWFEQGEQQQALQHYEQALKINPNNFNIAVSLAEKYLQVENFEKSLELHRKLYQADFQKYKEGYLHALSVYGHHLIKQKELSLAKKQYNEILEIEPNRGAARERLSEIETYENTMIRTSSIGNPRQQIGLQIRKWSALGKILAVITVSGTVGSGTYQFLSECLPGKQKEFGLVCVADKSRISNGDRTLFPNLKNTNRDLGIKAFKKENYKEAIKLFGQAVAANRNDPEVLIYYNNALARDKGNPITLAAAVPADNNANFAQEILRGVAQAQQQFNGINGKGGLNGRLLEIKIANDAGQAEQAKQVAAELVQDQSILGVVGHYSSDSTKAALEEYNKTDITIISPTTTSTQLQGRNLFRSLPDDAAGGKKLAEYAFNTLKLRKVVIFSNPDSSYSDSMREEFTKTFERLGGQLLRKPLINLADTSLDMEAEVYKTIYRDEYKAEAAVLIPDALHTDVALKIAKVNKQVIDRSQSRNRAIPGLKLLGGDILYSDQTLTKGGDAVEDLTIVVPWFREAPQATNFAQQTEKQWGGGVSWRTATSYDATQAFIQALSANGDRTTVIEKLKKVNLSPNNTSGDPLQFNLEGERKTDPILVQVQRGKWVKIQ